MVRGFSFPFFFVFVIDWKRFFEEVLGFLSLCVWLKLKNGNGGARSEAEVMTLRMR